MIYRIKEISASEVARAVSGKIISGNENLKISAVSCDSRTIDNKTLFIPLKGERFDGHDFLPDVCQRGVGGVLCHETCDIDAPFVIKVEDTQEALLDLASYYRNLFDIPVVGLTGSVGKTTTKEFVASVVSQKYNTLATKGNFNNNIGVPYTIFGLSDEHSAAVIEMGMSNFGEISVLSKCVRPHIGIITNIGTSHIEYLGSQEGILKAKSEIFDGMDDESIIILNGDDPHLLSLKGNVRCRKQIFLGIENEFCDIIATNVESSESGCIFDVDGKKYSINLPGAHNVYNALVAIAVGREMGIDDEKIKKGLESYHSDGIRQNIISINGYKIINDCYNSSPQSAHAALKVLECVEAKRRIAVLGDIAELGEKTEELLRELGKNVNESDADVLVTVGDASRFIAMEAKGKECYSFPNAEKAAEFLKDFLVCEDAVLIKGSRCMKMEKIYNILGGVQDEL